MPTSASFAPEDIEKYRSLAAKVLQERYHGNQSEMARDLGIGSSNISRFVVRKKGGLSSHTAKKLCDLAGVAFPLGSSFIPPPAPSRAGTELEKTLDYFDSRWPAEVMATARALDKYRQLPRNRQEWADILDRIEELLAEFK